MSFPVQKSLWQHVCVPLAQGNKTSDWDLRNYIQTYQSEHKGSLQLYVNRFMNIQKYLLLFELPCIWSLGVILFPTNRVPYLRGSEPDIRKAVCSPVSDETQITLKTLAVSSANVGWW
jgi:hypothetical protein